MELEGERSAEVVTLRLHAPRPVPLERAVQLRLDTLTPAPHRNVQRINGEKVHLHELSDESLETYIEFAYARREAADRDIETLLSEQASR